MDGSDSQVNAFEIYPSKSNENLQNDQTDLSENNDGSPSLLHEQASTISNESPVESQVSRKLAIYWHPACYKHNIEDHPEQPARVKFILKSLRSKFGDSPFVTFREASLGNDDHASLFHSHELIRSFNKKSGEIEALYSKLNRVAYSSIDGDTKIMHDTRAAAYRAIGSIIDAIDHLYLPNENELHIDTAFCCVRPPGHHAEPNRSMGFCFFNNAGIGAKYAQTKYGVKRVAVLDFDVHHGNGTEEGFKNDETLFYGSTHEKDNYPGTGKDPTPFIGDDAKSPLDRRIVNRYLFAGDASKKQFRVRWQQVVDEMEIFAPDLVIFSAGFDAHADDPLGNCYLTDDDFGWATDIVLAATKRINPRSPPPCISILEGGYDLDAIARSAVVHVESLLEGKPLLDQPKDFGGDEIASLKNVLEDLGI